jgi:isoleucyl-tRNA synthetase
MLIVSKAAVKAGDALAVQVRTAQGGKCERCWKVLSSVGSDSERPTLCSRCAAVVRKLV